MIWEHWICLFIIENNKEIEHSKGPGTTPRRLPPPQTILVTTFWKFVAKISICQNWSCLLTIGNTTGIAHSKIPGSRVTQTILITKFWDLVACIKTWENWNCLFIIAHAKGIVYPKGPVTPDPPNHVNYYILWLGGLDHHLGELNLFVYH